MNSENVTPSTFVPGLPAEDLVSSLRLVPWEPGDTLQGPRSPQEP